MADSIVVDHTGDALTAGSGRKALQVGILFAAALSLLCVVYVAFNVPGSWFPSARLVQWPARDLTVTRGTATLVGSRTPDHGTRREQYCGRLARHGNPGERLRGRGLDCHQRAGERRRAPAVAQRLRAAEAQLRDRPAWNPVASCRRSWRTIRIGSAASPDSPSSCARRSRSRCASRAWRPSRWAPSKSLRDRIGEWLAFEGWTGTSINTVTGGADVQGLPLPLADRVRHRRRRRRLRGGGTASRVAAATPAAGAVRVPVRLRMGDSRHAMDRQPVAPGGRHAAAVRTARTGATSILPRPTVRSSRSSRRCARSCRPMPPGSSWPAMPTSSAGAPRITSIRTTSTPTHSAT